MTIAYVTLTLSSLLSILSYSSFPSISSFLIVLEKDLISFQSIKQFINDVELSSPLQFEYPLVNCLVLVIVLDFIIESLKVYYVASSAYLALKLLVEQWLFFIQGHHKAFKQPSQM